MVAIAVPRSVEMVVSLLGILKTGAAYLPLDPEYPAERLRLSCSKTLETAFVGGTTSKVAKSVPPGVRCLRLDEPETDAALEQSRISNPEDRQRTRRLTPQHPAYVIYTSGSTGRPKGILVGLPMLNIARLFGSTEHWNCMARMVTFESLRFLCNLTFQC